MNIAITTLVTPNVTNGLSQYIRFLVNALQDIESSHTFYIIVNKSFESSIEIKKANFHKVVTNIPHHPRVIMRPVYFFWQNLMFGKFLKKNKIDVFHIPNPIPLINNYGIPTVVTIHDVAELRGFRHSGLHRLFRIFSNYTSAKKSDQIITVSDFSKKELLSLMKVDGNKIHVTHPGLTLKTNIDSDSKQTFDVPYFLFVGTAELHKNLENVLKAFSQLRTEKKIDLYVVGRIKKPELYTKYIQSYKNRVVHFKGAISEKELKTYYENAIALVYTSLYEGFGLPVLESMSLGTPVITTSGSSMEEVAGDAAIYVNSSNASSIGSAMEVILKDEVLKNKLSEKGLERTQKFNWIKTAKKTIEIYEIASSCDFNK